MNAWPLERQSETGIPSSLAISFLSRLYRFWSSTCICVPFSSRTRHTQRALPRATVYPETMLHVLNPPKLLYTVIPLIALFRRMIFRERVRLLYSVEPCFSS